MINLEHARELVIRPVLESLGMWSESAEALVLGTGVQESTMFNLRQIGGGPALGLYQCEPATHDDLWHWVIGKPDLERKMHDLFGQPDSAYLVGIFNYATAICRLHYWRRPEPLPVVADVEGMARYWKAHYNTELGDGTPESFVRLYKRYVL